MIRDDPNNVFLETKPIEVSDSSKSLNSMGLKQQEKYFEELKKENLDLKIKLQIYEDNLSKYRNANLDNLLDENKNLKVKNEALVNEITSFKTLLHDSSNDMNRHSHSLSAMRDDEEISRLKQELDITNAQLTKSNYLARKYENQMNLLEQETRQNLQSMKQLEMENVSLKNKANDLNTKLEEAHNDTFSYQEEIDRKNSLIQQFRLEINSSTSDYELLTQKYLTLENSYRSLKDEHDSMIQKASLERIQRNIRDSPRSSLDIVESKLLAELGQTSKQLQEMDKMSTMNASEKEHLQNQARQLTLELQNNSLALFDLAKRLCNATGKELSISEDDIQFTNTFPINHNQNDNEIEIENNYQSVISNINNPFTNSSQAIIEEIERIVIDLLRDKDELEKELANLVNQINKLNNNLQKASYDTIEIQEKIKSTSNQNSQLKSLLDSKNEELQTYAKTINELKAREQSLLKEINELTVENGNSINRINTLTNKIHETSHRIEVLERDLLDSNRKFSTLESQGLGTIQQLSEKQDLVSRLSSTRDELMRKLSNEEEASRHLSKQLEETKSKLQHNERVRTATQEQFNEELKSLHATNSDLRLQLSQISNGSSDINNRYEKLYDAFKAIQDENQILMEKTQNKDDLYRNLQREKELIQIENRKMDEELKDRQVALAKLESDLNRLKREEHLTRKNTDSSDHLQSKVDSLSTLNNFLKEQSESKERQIIDLQERLRKQGEEMRHAYTEIENQTRKLKKRELLISQALKRLEALNTMKLGAGVNNIRGGAFINNEDINESGGMGSNSNNIKNESNPAMMSSHILEGLTGLRGTSVNNNLSEEF